MKSYESYKDSGIEWIGSVPKHWEIVPFKRVMRIKNGQDYKDFAEDDGYPVIGSGGCFAYCSKYIYDGEAILLGRKGTIDRPLYINGKFWTVDTMFYAYSKMKSSTKYMYYQSLTIPFEKYKTATALPSMTQTDLGYNSFCVPPFAEQQEIVSYLDKKCEEIEKAIAKQQKRIELLQELRQSIITNAVTRGINPDVPLKDSGIEWIGPVPKHWEVTKLKVVCKVITDYVASGSFADLKENVTYLDEPNYAMLVRTADLSNKNKEIKRVYVSKASYNFLVNSNLYGGEIVLPNIGASIGDVYIVPHDLYEKMTLAPNSIMIKTKYLDMYYYFFFSSRYGRESLALIGQAAAQGKFNKTDLRQLRVPVPPFSEQQKIVTYIKSYTATFDKAIIKAERCIELLQEMKQSIITEAVTGKIKVC